MKTSRLYHIILLFLLAISLSAQTQQRGVVLEYVGDDEMQPLANVEISVEDASVATSDAKGRFTLRFKTAQPGDPVRVIWIEKPGYEIFNWSSVKGWHLSDGNSEFEIVMCRSDQLLSLTERYLRHHSSTYNTQYLNSRFRMEDARRQSGQRVVQYDQLIQQTKTEHNSSLNDINTYITNFDSLQDIVQDIHFLERRMAAKQVTIDTLKTLLLAHVNELRRSGDKVKRMRADTILGRMAGAMSADLSLRIAYTQLLYDNGSTMPALSSARALLSNPKLSVSDQLYMRQLYIHCLNQLGLYTSTVEQVIQTRDLLNANFPAGSEYSNYILRRLDIEIGYARFRQNFKDRAFVLLPRAYENTGLALKNYSQDCPLSVYHYRAERADAALHYAQLLQSQHEDEKALNCMKEAISLYAQIEEEQRYGRYLSRLGYAQYAAGIYARRLSRFDESEQLLNDAIATYDRMERGLPVFDYWVQQNAKNSLGSCFYWQGKYEEALQYTTAAVDYIETHHLQPQGSHQADYFMTFLNLGMAHLSLGHIKEAEQYWEKYWPMYDQLLRVNDEYRVASATYLEVFSQLAFEKGERERGVEMLNEALERASRAEIKQRIEKRLEEIRSDWDK